MALDESCYREIRFCHILVLIIGGRYGSEASEERERAAILKDSDGNLERTRQLSRPEKDKRFTFYNSVTSKEAWLLERSDRNPSPTPFAPLSLIEIGIVNLT